MGKLTERLDRPIVLVGLMGAGKSTVGRRLAKRLGLPFIDTDAAIAKRIVKEFRGAREPEVLQHVEIFLAEGARKGVVTWTDRG